MQPLRFQVAIRRRLHWPLPLSGGQCCKYCPQDRDCLGDRAAACSRSGRLKTRARPVEKMLARVMREAGGLVRENFFLRKAGITSIDPADGWQIEVVVSGLPLARGIPLALDATLVSPLSWLWQAALSSRQAAQRELTLGRENQGAYLPRARWQRKTALVDSCHRDWGSS